MKYLFLINCWQGDDIAGFETQGSVDGGSKLQEIIRARSGPDELMQDFSKALDFIGGSKKIALHASYRFADDSIDRDQIEPEHFDPWIDYAKDKGIGIDFNPTFFGHPRVKDNLTLSSPDKETREFWIRHGIQCRKIAAHIAEAVDDEVVNNIWIPDGMKDTPGQRLIPRKRLTESLDAILEDKYEGVIDSVESKFFGIGLESYTVGSSDYYIAYSASRDRVYPLLDAGHFHPSEYISDKISSLLLFFDYLPLHVSRPVNWDSDHVVALDDELLEIAREIVRNDALDRVKIGLDFFDASINRIAAWIIGTRNVQKALLFALLQPNEALCQAQDAADYTKLLMLREEFKVMPYTAIWEEWCQREGVVPGMEWFEDIKAYERDVLSARQS